MIQLRYGRSRKQLRHNETKLQNLVFMIEIDFIISIYVLYIIVVTTNGRSRK